MVRVESRVLTFEKKGFKGRGGSKRFTSGFSKQLSVCGLQVALQDHRRRPFHGLDRCSRQSVLGLT